MAICGVIILGYVPISAAAEEAEGLCEYHISHDFDVCGFTVQSDEKPCNHVCDEGCITEVIRCAHEHSEEAGCRFVEAQAEQVCGHTCSVESCGYVMAAEGAECTLGCESVDENGKVIHGEGCGFAEAVEGQECGFVHEGCGCAAAVEAHWECDHVCSAESGCVTVETNCVHTAHDEACGYAAASDGTPCSFAVNGCEQCAQEDEDCTCDVKCAEGAVDAECALKILGIAPQAFPPVTTSALASLLAMTFRIRSACVRGRRPAVRGLLMRRARFALRISEIATSLRSSQ